MGNIKIVRGVFDTKIELEHAGVAAGWSDQDIDEVFDGEPDAYWNID